MKVFLLIFFVVPGVFASPPSPEVCARNGCVRGVTESGRLKPYEAFYGIPYAEPPVGKLRFKNPVPFNGWTGYWNASYYRSDCYQKNYFLLGQPISGSEDCLYLNIYRPQDWWSKGKLPVFVWIHGGSYVSFSSNPELFGPHYFMDNGGVILVTLNYRLGLFGFLCSGGDGVVQGNFGLKDQQLALEWVSRNIEAFGGDSQSVTVGGQSCGAVSTNLQMLNSKSQALFHRAFLASGTAISPFVYPLNSEAVMRTAAKITGILDWDSGSTTSLANQMKNLPAITLVNAIDDLFTAPLAPVVPVTFCIEGDWEGAFITEDPRKIWAEGRFVQKPILIGITSDEGVVFGAIVTNKTVKQAYNADIYRILPIQLDFHPRWASEVLKYYFGRKDYIDDTNENNYFKMMGDRLLRFSLIQVVREYIQYADVERNPIFIYEFGFKGKYTFFQYLTGTDENRGVAHLDDLIYIFSMSALFPIMEPESPEGKMSDVHVRNIVTFAKTGKVRKWRPFKPCTLSTSQPFCDYQVFNRSTIVDPNQVVVSVSNFIDTEMVKFWLKVDRGDRVLETCP